MLFLIMVSDLDDPGLLLADDGTMYVQAETLEEALQEKPASPSRGGRYKLEEDRGVAGRSRGPFGRASRCPAGGKVSLEETRPAPLGGRQTQGPTGMDRSWWR